MTARARGVPYPKFQTQGEQDAYHRGQRDALDAAIARLEWKRRRGKTIPEVSDHPSYLAARRGYHTGVYHAIGQVLHLRYGKNINQRIKAVIGHERPIQRPVEGGDGDE